MSNNGVIVLLNDGSLTNEILSGQQTHGGEKSQQGEMPAVY